jgi:hypothetical protein
MSRRYISEAWIVVRIVEGRPTSKRYIASMPAIVVLIGNHSSIIIENR